MIPSRREIRRGKFRDIHDSGRGQISGHPWFQQYNFGLAYRVAYRLADRLADRGHPRINAL
jgi:hypothetical protein